MSPDAEPAAYSEPPAGSTSAIRQWSQDAHDASIVAQSLAQTSFPPKEMQNRPAQITAAILTGQEIGLAPMAALRSIDIIQGVPAMRAHALRGLVQAAGHEVWVDDESNAHRAIVYGRRKGESTVQKSTWTMDRARDLGLTEKENYRKQPGVMLIARGTAEVCRLIASDVLLGMPYAVEELDTAEADTTPAKPRKAGKRTAQRQPVHETPQLSEPEPSEVQPQASGASPEPVEGGEDGAGKPDAD